MPYKSGNWRDSHTVTEEDLKFKTLEPNTIGTTEGAVHCSPANLTVRKIRDEVSSPPSVQAPVDADRYQGVVTQWYSPLSLEEDTSLY